MKPYESFFSFQNICQYLQVREEFGEIIEFSLQKLDIVTEKARECVHVLVSLGHKVRKMAPFLRVLIYFPFVYTMVLITYMVHPSGFL